MICMRTIVKKQSRDQEDVIRSFRSADPASGRQLSNPDPCYNHMSATYGITGTTPLGGQARFD